MGRPQNKNRPHGLATIPPNDQQACYKVLVISEASAPKRSTKVSRTRH